MVSGARASGCHRNSCWASDTACSLVNTDMLSHFQCKNKTAFLTPPSSLGVEHSDMTKRQVNVVSFLHQSVSLEAEVLGYCDSWDFLWWHWNWNFYWFLSSNLILGAPGTKKSLTHTVAYLGHNSCNWTENPISFSNVFGRYEATQMIYSKYYFHAG